MTLSVPLKPDLPILFFATSAEWEAWLADNYAQDQGVWLKFAKKASGIKSVVYDEALDVALCYGWIDGQSKSLDDMYYLQKFTPRRARSVWSERNVGKVAELAQAGKMKPSGMAAANAAKADGRWEQAYASPATITMPDDFKVALKANPKAKAFYETLNKTNPYAVLWRIYTARKPETRVARIEKLITMLEAGQKLH